MSRQRSLETILKAEYVTIGELVRLTDTRYSTLKYYTEEGMLPFEQEEENLTRRYPREASIRRIQEIKELRKEGMTISEIKEVLCVNNQKTSVITVLLIKGRCTVLFVQRPDRFDDSHISPRICRATYTPEAEAWDREWVTPLPSPMI